jgi:nitroreductase
MTTLPGDGRTGPPVEVGAEDALRAAVDLARYAPSLHNAQPWAWRVSGEVAELSADPARALPVADPSGREMLLGCGAALHHARVALAAAGWSAQVTRLPDPEQPDLLARLRLAGRAEPDPAGAELVEAIRRRRTDRRPYADLEVSAAALATLRQAAESEHAYVSLVTSVDQRIELAVLAEQAARLQQADPAYLVELAAWTSPRSDGTGVPPAVVPRLTEPRHSDVPVRDFTLARPGELPVPAAIDESPYWVVLYTENDGPLDRLRAGEAMSRVLLAATAAGLACGPQSQPVEVPRARTQLEARLLAGLGHAQLTVRIGWPDPAAAPLPAVPRRPLEDVLRTDPAR